MNALNVQLLFKLSKRKDDRQESLLNLFRVISEFAILAFDFDFYYAYVKSLDYSIDPGVLIRDFYNQTLAYDEHSASNLLRHFSIEASNAKSVTVEKFLLSLMKELLLLANTSSPEVRTCLQSLVEVYITKTVGKEPAKPEDWARSEEVHECYRGCEVCPMLNEFLKDPKAKEKTTALNADSKHHVEWCFRFLEILEIGNGSGEREFRYTKTLKGWEKRHRDWESNVEAAQKNLQALPKDALKEALGDEYDTLMALDSIRIDKRTAQAPDKAQPPTRSKHPRDDDTEHKENSKRARVED